MWPFVCLKISAATKHLRYDNTAIWKYFLYLTFTINEIALKFYYALHIPNFADSVSSGNIWLVFMYIILVVPNLTSFASIYKDYIACYVMFEKLSPHRIGSKHVCRKFLPNKRAYSHAIRNVAVSWGHFKLPTFLL